MKVRCPKCSSTYDLDPAKIAPAGIKVRCPSCSHVFMVKKKEAAAPGKAGGSPGADEAIALDDFAPDAGPVAAPKPAAAPKAAPPPPAAPKAAPPAPPRPAAPPSPAAASKAEVPSEPISEGAFTGEGQWRVKKSGLGLVYGPADMDTLESWIKAERVGRQDQYSLDGGAWLPPSTFEIVAKKLHIPYEGPPRSAAVPAASKPATTMPPAPKPAAPRPAPVPSMPPEMAPAAGGFDVPAAEDPFAEPPPKPKKNWGPVIGAATGGILVIAVIACATVYFLAPSDAAEREQYLSSIPSFLHPIANLAPVDAVPVIPPPPVVEEPKDPVSELAKKVPGTQEGPYREAVISFYRDSVEGYKRSAEGLAAIAEQAQGAAPHVKGLHAIVRAMAAYRNMADGDKTQIFEALLIESQALKDVSPADSFALDAYAFSLLGLGRGEEAGAVAEESLRVAPNGVIARYIRAQVRTPGIQDLEEAVKIEPRFNAAALILAQLRLDAGDVAGARDLIGKIFERMPDHSGALEFYKAKLEPLGTGEAVVPSEAASGEVAATGGSIAAPSSGTSSPKDSTGVPAEDPFKLFESGKALFEKKEYAQAERILLKVLNDHYEEIGLANAAIVHYLLGEIYRVGGKSDMAKAQYEASLQIAPKFGKARQALDSITGASAPPPAAAAPPPPPPPAPAPSEPAAELPAPPPADAAVSTPPAQ